MPKTLEQKAGLVKEWLGTGSINFFARQFGGKDEQAERLAPHLNAQVIGGGDILRHSQMAPEILAAMKRGELIASDVYEETVFPYLGQIAFRDQPLLLSSVGRLKGEEDGVLAATTRAGHPIKVVPYLYISEEESFWRLEHSNRNRPDDTPAGLRTRLDAFNELTLPVINKYEELGLLLPINGMNDEEVVFRMLVDKLHTFARTS